MREYCREAKNTVPFFRRMGEKRITGYVRERIEEFNTRPIVPGRDVEGRRR